MPKKSEKKTFTALGKYYAGLPDEESDDEHLAKDLIFEEDDAPYELRWHLFAASRFCLSKCR